MAKFAKNRVYAKKHTQNNPSVESEYKFPPARMITRAKLSGTPRISVIMPVYNVADYVRESLDSVCSQSLRDIEIICVDDGSTDNSVEIIREYAKHEKRITLLSQQNSGSGPARNNGMRNATGEFIAFLDPDDFYPSAQTLENMYTCAIENNALICGGSLSQLKEGQIITDPSKFEPEYSFASDGFIEYSDYQFDYGYWRFIYNRSFLNKNNLFFPDYMRQQDPVFFVRAMATAGRFYALAQATYTYRVSYKQVNWNERRVLDTVKAITDCMNMAKKYKLHKLHDNIANNRINNNWFIRAFRQFAHIPEIRDRLVNLASLIDYQILHKTYPDFNLSPFYGEIGLMPNICVIVPVYNVAEYLPKCLDSLINQTYKNLTIICVNDGSTDSSGDILAKYAKQDSRIRVITQENQGLSAARNTGLAHCTSEYVYFIDSDDYILPETIETLYREMTAANVDVAIGGVKCFGDMPDNEIAAKQKWMDKFLIKTGRQPMPINIRGELLSTAWNKLYKTSIINKFNIRFPVGLVNEDEYWLWAYMIHCNSYINVNQPFYQYLQRANSIMGVLHTDSKVLHKLEIYKRICDTVHEHGMMDKYKSVLEQLLPIFTSSMTERLSPTLYDEFVARMSDFAKNHAISDAQRAWCQSQIKRFSVRVVHQNQINGTPLVSVIIPAYRAEKCMSRCLDSLRKQTLQNIEIICVDDGSPDKTLDMLVKYAKSDPRITVLTQPNQRQGQARNNGLRFARGEYVFFCDIDDWMDETCLEKLYNKITSDKSDLCVFGALTYHEDTDKYTVENYRDTSMFANRTSDVCNCLDIKRAVFSHFYPWCKLYKRTLITDNNISFPPEVFFEDVIFSVKCMILAKRISVLDENLYIYRADQATSTMGTAKSSDKSADVFYFLQLVYDFLHSQGLYWDLQPEYIDFFIDQVKYHYGRTDVPSIRQSFYRQAIAFINKNNLNMGYQNLKQFYNMLDSMIERKNALVVEINDCHCECMPGYIDYLLKLGYRVDALIDTSQEKEHPLDMFNGNSLVKYKFIPSDDIIAQINSGLLDGYDVCIFNSNILYFYGTKSVLDVVDIKSKNTKIVCVEHRLENVPELSRRADCIVLKKFDNRMRAHQVNPHYFGAYPEHNAKSGVVNFVVAGNIQKARKNYDALIGAVAGLDSAGVKNFKITIIGRGYMDSIPQHLRHYFDIKGRLSYPDMYNEMSRADYFLTLLDPDYPDHDRYVSLGTSGSFQLIYGFTLPCLIAEKFASVHHFNHSNSILYRDNADLMRAMSDAIAASDASYRAIKDALAKTASGIYQESLENMRALLASTKKYKYKRRVKNTVSKKPYILYPYYALWVMWAKLVRKPFLVAKSDRYKRSVQGRMDVLSAELNGVANNVALIGRKYDVLHQQINAVRDFVVAQSATNTKQITDVLSGLRRDMDVHTHKISDTVSSKSSDLVNTLLNQTDMLNQYLCGYISDLGNDIGYIAQNTHDMLVYGRDDIVSAINRNTTSARDDIVSAINRNTTSARDDIVSAINHNASNIDTSLHAFGTGFDGLGKRLNDIDKNIDMHMHNIGKTMSDSADAYISEFHKAVSDVKTDVLSNVSNETGRVLDSIADMSRSNVGLMDVVTENQKIGRSLIDTASWINNKVSKLPEDIEWRTKRVMTLNSEPYWANVYHDTILNSRWLANKSVSPGRWAVSYIVLYIIYRILDEVQPKSILECGLGQSSKLTIQYADNHGTDLMICENNPEWASFFARQFPTAEKYTKFLDLEMTTVVEPHLSRTYSGFDDAIAGKTYDFILIDGPLGCEHYSRPEILNAANHLDKSFVIMLDDMNRPGEQETWELLKQQLTDRGIEFRERIYSSDKSVGLLCSPDLEFLTTL